MTPFLRLFTEGIVYPLGGRWYLSPWKEKVNDPSEEILQQKETLS